MCVNLYLGFQFQVGGDQLIGIKTHIDSTDNEHCGQDEEHLGGKICASVTENEDIQDSGTRGYPSLSITELCIAPHYS